MKSLSLLTPCFALAASLLAAAWPAAAQDRVYRCGNEYTNQVKGRKDCKLVEGGNVTVVRGTMPAAAAAPAPAPAPYSSSGAAAPVRSAAAAPAAPRPAAPRIDSPEQRARDSDAQAILKQELARAEARQAELEKEYNNGEPERLGSERNYQKYLDRKAEMKASIDRNQADIEGIKRELARFNR